MALSDLVSGKDALPGLHMFICPMSPSLASSTVFFQKHKSNTESSTFMIQLPTKDPTALYGARLLASCINYSPNAENWIFMSMWLTDKDELNYPKI